MAGRPVGEIVISLDLDPTAYTNAQKKILAGAKEATGSIDAQWRKLGGNTDAYYDAMAKSFMNSHQKIINTGFQTTDTIVRSYQLMNVKLAALDQERYAAKNAALQAEKAAEKAAITAREANYTTLGMKSAADVKQRISDVTMAATAQQLIVGKSSEDWIRIERAKNEKLKALNKEMTGDHEMSMASMTRAVLRWYAAIYVAQMALQYLSIPFIKGFKAVEEYNTAVASMAAMVVTFGDNMRGLSLDGQWKNALAYSTAIIPVLEKIAAKTLLSGQETIALANAFARSGVFLDENNKKQMDSFTRISNALPLMTRGQEITRQINTEVRSLMTGMNEQSSMMLITLKAIDPQIEKHIAQWRATDTVLEHIGDLLKGFGPATEILEKQWQAVKTSIDTTVTQILRGGMKPIYEDIIKLTQELDKWLQTNKKSILDTIDELHATAKVLKGIYDAAPSGTFEAASMGIIGKILWGNQVGLFIAAISMVNTKLKETNMHLGSMPKKAIDAWEAIKNIFKPQGPRVYTVPDIGALPPLTQQEKANSSVIKIMKMMDETILKNHKESIAEYDKATNLQMVAFKEAGATEEFINKYLEKRIVLKEQQFSLDKKAEKSAEDLAKLLEKMRETMEGFALSGLDGSRKAFEQNRLEAEKLRKEFEKLPTAQKEIMYAEIAASQASKDALVVNNMVQKSRDENTKMMAKEAAATRKINDAYDKLMNTVAPTTDRTYEMSKAVETITEKFEKGTPVWQEAIDKVNAYYAALDKKQAVTDAEKAATNAERQVEIYKGLVGFEDEFRQKQLLWIEKVRVKELLYIDEKKLAEKEAAREREAVNKKASDSIVKIQRAEFDEKAKQIQSGLGDMASMFTSLSGMYAKNSSEANRMQELANVAIVLQKGVAVVNAVSAVAAAAVLPPPAGFVSMAAMAAAMASLLGSIGISFGGGSGSASISAPTAGYGVGTTTLGGTNDEASQSISNSWELMQDTYDMQDTKLTGIYNEMKQLNANITGIVRGIVTGGIGSLTMGGLGTSKSSAYFDATKDIPIWSDLDKIALKIPILGNIAESVVNWLFGSGSSSTSQTASGIVVGGGVVKPYATSTTQSSWSGPFGGLFGGGGSSTTYNRMEGAVNETLTNLFYGEHGVYTTLKKNVADMARMLGGDVAMAENKVFAAFELNLMGMDSDAIEKAVSGQISAISDNFVREVFASLINAYQEVGEGAYETISRLAIDLASITDILEMTGRTMIFTGSSAVALSESLITLAGGLDKLSEAANTYYDKFFTDAEKQTRLQEQLTDTLSAYNMILPRTRQGYRNLVEVQNLYTESGKEAYVTLLKLAEYADEYYTVLEEVTNKQGELIASLREQSQTITQWLSDLTRSSQAPVASLESYQVEYARQKGLASAPGSTEDQLSAYLDYSKQYLDFMRSYGGDYNSIYTSVTGDVLSLKTSFDAQATIAEQQLAAIQAADDAARLAAIKALDAAEKQAAIAVAQLNEQKLMTAQAQLAAVQAQLTATQAQLAQAQAAAAAPSGGGFEITDPGTWFGGGGWWEKGGAFSGGNVIPFASGDVINNPHFFPMANGMGVMGEAGPEAIMPLSRGVDGKLGVRMNNVIPFRGAKKEEKETVIHNHLYIDGKEVGNVVAKQTRTNRELISAIRGLN